MWDASAIHVYTFEFVTLHYVHSNILILLKVIPIYLLYSNKNLEILTMNNYNEALDNVADSILLDIKYLETQLDSIGNDILQQYFNDWKSRLVEIQRIANALDLIEY